MNDLEKIKHDRKIDWETEKHARKLRREKAFQEDKDKERRRKRRNCKDCTYLKTTVALQAFTNSKCTLCNALIVNPSSDVDAVCKSCSVEKNLCVHCGKELD